MEQVLNDLWGGVKDSHMPNGKKCGISEETYIRIHESQFIGYWPYKHIKSSTISLKTFLSVLFFFFPSNSTAQPNKQNVA